MPAKRNGNGNGRGKATVESGTVRWRGSLYPAQRASDGTVQRNTKVDGSGEWVAEPHTDRFVPEGVDNIPSRPVNKDGTVFVLRSVRAPENVWTAAKQRADAEGVSMNALMVAAMVQYAKGEWTPGQAPAKPKALAPAADQVAARRQGKAPAKKAAAKKAVTRKAAAKTAPQGGERT